MSTDAHSSSGTATPAKHSWTGGVCASVFLAAAIGLAVWKGPATIQAFGHFAAECAREFEALRDVGRPHFP